MPLRGLPRHPPRLLLRGAQGPLRTPSSPAVHPEINPFAPPCPPQAARHPSPPLPRGKALRAPRGAAASGRGLVRGSVSQRPPPLPHARSGQGAPARPGAARRGLGPLLPRTRAAGYLRVAEGHGGPFQWASALVRLLTLLPPPPPSSRPHIHTRIGRRACALAARRGARGGRARRARAAPARPTGGRARREPA